MIHVMLVDDSSFMRKLTKNMIEETGEIKVIEEAKNGEEALKKWHPEIDVVLLDVEMPKMNGLEVLKEWHMKHNKVPVIMFSSLTKRGAEETIEALNLGAFDFIQKPSNPVLLNKKKEEIIDKIILASKTKSIRPRSVSRTPFVEKSKVAKPLTKNVHNLVLIGCSTGGPKALKEIIPMFPGNINAAILIVQHMPKGDYTRSLADTLDKISEITVREAEDGLKMENGCAYIAPGGFQMKINNAGHLVVTEDEPESGHAPSVDYMFREVFQKKGSYHLVPAVLTGMGGDGSKSSYLLSQNGIKTIVESEETCVVFGMPRKVIEIGSDHIVKKLEDIPKEIQKNLI